MEDVSIVTVIIAAVAAAVPGIAFGFYNSFRMKAMNDGVKDWKDEVVKTVDGFAKKVNEAE